MPEKITKRTAYIEHAIDQRRKYVDDRLNSYYECIRAYFNYRNHPKLNIPKQDVVIKVKRWIKGMRKMKIYKIMVEAAYLRYALKEIDALK